MSYAFPYDELRLVGEKVQVLHRGVVMDEIGVLWALQRHVEHKRDLYEDRGCPVYEEGS